jgi:phosphoribosyl 1,2-cyclic phosphate phosphodiesterase
MKVTILGSGTSQGVPVIGCGCLVCTSADPRDARLRVSILLQAGAGCVVVDAGPDFRQQMLRAGVTTLDAILLTHEHNDHIIGLDDVRPFIFSQQRAMHLFCSAQVEGELRQRFAYAFADSPYPGAPTFQLSEIVANTPFEVAGMAVVPIQYWHGTLPVTGFRIGGFAYLTDIKTIPDEEVAKLAGLNTLVISALHHEPHHSHANLTEALAIIARIAPQRAYLTHISHRMGLHTEVEPTLPPNIHLAYDGLEIED